VRTVVTMTTFELAVGCLVGFFGPLAVYALTRRRSSGAPPQEDLLGRGQYDPPPTVEELAEVDRLYELPTPPADLIGVPEAESLKAARERRARYLAWVDEQLRQRDR